MKDLKNKKILVTGASGGIGNSIVEKLVENDANILASGTRIEKLEELQKKFKNIKILKFDISQTENIEEFIENASKQIPFNLENQVPFPSNSWMQCILWTFCSRRLKSLRQNMG